MCKLIWNKKQQQQPIYIGILKNTDMSNIFGIVPPCLGTKKFDYATHKNKVTWTSDCKDIPFCYNSEKWDFFTHIT